MDKTRVVALLSAVAVSAALITGCTVTGSGKANENRQNASETTQNANDQAGSEQNSEAGETSGSKSLSGYNKPSKEEILKDMLDIPMEDFEAVDLEGNSVKLSDYKGKIIFLNFWATWCPPCREEMPFMQELHDKYKDQDVVILTVNPTSVELRGGTDSGKAEKQVRKFIQDNGYTFPVLLDKKDDAWGIYQQRGIPANYVIDKQGIIRYGFSGAFQGREQMEQLIGNIRAIE